MLQQKEVTDLEDEVWARYQKFFERSGEWLNEEIHKENSEGKTLFKVFEESLTEQREEEQKKLAAVTELYEKRWGPDFLELRGRKRERE